MNNYIQKETVLDFLRENPFMNISIIGSNGLPLASVVMFTVDNNFTFHFTASSVSHKTKALMKNNNISFSIWVHNKMLVQADGIATSINENIGKYLDELANMATSVENFWPPILRVPEKDYIVFEIKPTWIRAMDLSTYNIHEKENPYKILYDEKYV